MKSFFLLSFGKPPRIAKAQARSPFWRFAKLNLMKEIVLLFFLSLGITFLAAAQGQPELLKARIINANCKVNYLRIPSDSSDVYLVNLAFVSSRNLWFSLVLENKDEYIRFKNDLLDKTRETTLIDKSQYYTVSRRKYYISKSLQDDTIQLMLTNNQERWVMTKEVAKELSLYINSIDYGN